VAPVRVERPDVHVDRLVRDDGTVFAFFRQLQPGPLEVEPELEDGRLAATTFRAGRR